MASLQHLPWLGTAEDDLLFVEWLVEVGGDVRKGQSVAAVETLKAAFEVEAEHDGTLLRRLCAAGDRVAAQAPIAVLGVAGEACDDRVVEQLTAVRQAVDAGNAPQKLAVPVEAPRPFGSPEPAAQTAAPVAPAARRRAAELGVDLATVTGGGPEGLVRVVDVEQAKAAGGADVEGEPNHGDGAVDPEFLAMIRRDEPAFAALASDFKLMLYRRHGARIGPDCRLGAGAVLKVDRLRLGRGAFFGPECVIEAAQLTAGEHLHFGARCRVRCTTARFGDNAFFADDVEIGGGGAMEPEAELVVGSHGFVGERSHLNPCRPLRIGDEVVVSRSAVVMTHSFGASWLRGYPSRFAGVAIGDGAQIGIAAVLFPGVEIGDGAVVLSGSSVVTAVPARRLWGGVPAVDLKAAARQLSVDELEQRAGELVTEFARQLELRGMAVDVAVNGQRRTIAVIAGDGVHRLEFAPAGAFAPVTPGRESVLVAVRFPAAEFNAVASDATAIELEPPRIRGAVGPLAGAFREFLRKRGVRLRPRNWIYEGGWL